MKKFLSVLLAAVMLFSVVPFAASAASSEPKTTTINGATYYKIGTADELVWFSNYVKSGGEVNAVLTKNIDLSKVESWTPIGTSQYKYMGVFDGANYTVSGLKNSLFGNVYGGAIKNIAVSGDISNTDGDNYIGMVACEIQDSLLYNCKAVGKVSFEKTSEGARCYAGGIVGAALHSVIINCAAQTDVDVSLTTSVEYAAVGGVAGVATVDYNIPYCILNSYCVGDITVSGNVLKSTTQPSSTAMRFYVGGIAGYLKDDAVNNYYSGTITDKEAADTVKKIGYAFGYVYPEYSSSKTNEDGSVVSEKESMFIKNNYYPAGKTAIGAVESGYQESSDWTTGVTANDNLVDLLNANLEAVSSVIETHRKMLNDSTWKDIAEKANGDAVTVSEWEKGEDNLPVLSGVKDSGEGEGDGGDDPVVPECNHMCHKKGFMGFIWTIVRFFQKAFGTNPVCECGAAHY